MRPSYQLFCSQDNEVCFPHRSAFVSGDVFLQRYHIGDGLDGHQVNTWQDGSKHSFKNFSAIKIRCIWKLGQFKTNQPHKNYQI